MAFLTHPNFLPMRWRHLTDEDKAGIESKFFAIIWAIAFLCFTPSAYATVIDRSVTITYMTFIIAGAIAGISGRLFYQHLRFELPGLFLLLGGLVFYAVVQFSYVFTGNTDRIALSILALWIASTFFRRFWYLLSKFADALRKDD